MTARPQTTPAAPASPWTNRIATRAGPLGAAAQARDRTRKAIGPPTTKTRRPIASLMGPNATWPSASPIRNEVRVRPMTAPLECRSRAMRGRADRYMSVASGDTPVTRISAAIDGSRGGRERVPAGTVGEGKRGVHTRTVPVKSEVCQSADRPVLRVE